MTAPLDMLASAALQHHHATLQPLASATASAALPRFAPPAPVSAAVPHLGQPTATNTALPHYAPTPHSPTGPPTAAHGALYRAPTGHRRRPTLVRPKLAFETTPSALRKFHMDWSIFKHLADIEEQDSIIELYSCCDEKLQSAIYTAHPQFMLLDENAMLQLIRQLINNTRTRAATRKHLQTVTQQPGECMIDYSTRILQAANDCNFVCHSCKADLTDEHARDQLMIGLSDLSLQKEVICRDGDLPLYNDVLRYCTTHEAATSDQQTVRREEGVAAAAHTKPPHRPARAAPQRPKQAAHGRATPPKTHCPGCGASQAHHRATQCPAWGAQCRNCKRLHHFEAVCRQSKDSSAAHVSWNPDSATFQPDTPTPLQYVTADI